MREVAATADHLVQRAARETMINLPLPLPLRAFCAAPKELAAARAAM
jgi:hypothetical protein